MLWLIVIIVLSLIFTQGRRGKVRTRGGGRIIQAKSKIVSILPSDSRVERKSARRGSNFEAQENWVGSVFDAHGEDGKDFSQS